MEKLKNKSLIEQLKEAMVQCKISLDAHIHYNPKDAEDEEYVSLYHDMELIKSLLPEQ